MRLTNGLASTFTPLMQTAPINGSGNIDDDHTLSTSTWSSQKISNELATKANATDIPTPATTAQINEIISSYTP